VAREAVVVEKLEAAGVGVEAAVVVEVEVAAVA